MKIFSMTILNFKSNIENLVSYVSNVYIQSIFLVVISTISLSMLYPQIGIRDIDAYAYIVGSYSIQDAQGYYSLDGEPLNHWPPGYSLLLSLFDDPINVSMIINYVSFGLVVGLLFFIARRNKWHIYSSFGLSVALGFGFFRNISTNTTPDILNYFVFFIGYDYLCLREEEPENI